MHTPSIEMGPGVRLAGCKYCGLVSPLDGCVHYRPAGYRPLVITMPARLCGAPSYLTGTESAPSLTVPIGRNGLPLPPPSASW